jgi:hypothetical protein
MRVLAVCLALGALVSAAAGAAWSESSPSTAVCGSPSRVANYATVGRGAALGPLVLRLNDGREGVAEKTFTPGFPTRVVIRGRAALRTDVKLRGYQCGTDQRLRFWYRTEPLTFPNGFPATVDELQHKGDVSLRFPATRKIGGTYSGYVLFWAPGEWRLVLSAGRTTVASVVVRVSEETVE